MHEWCLIAGMGIGAIASIAHVATWIRRGQKPELSIVVEILISALGVGVAVKLAFMIAELPSTVEHPITLEDRFFFAFGALALGWVSTETIIRKFKP